jgi:hypothetical protein
VCVYVTGYRLGPWRSYRHETGTSMNPKGDIGEKVSQKVTISQITEENVTPLMILNGKILLYIFAFHFERSHF